MKVQVLGFWGTYPGPGEATTGFLLDMDGKRILLDCGSGVLAQLLKVCQIEALDGVIVTHHHHDHVADLGVLSYALLLSRLTGVRTEPLPVYLPKANSDAVVGLEQEPLAQVHFIDADSQISLAGCSVRFAATTHPVYCLSPRFESEGKTFVFSADTSWNDQLIDHVQEADLFICEASMYKGMEDDARQAGHLTSHQAGLLAQAAGAKRLAITHYPHYGDLAQLHSEAAAAFGNPVEVLSTLQLLTV